MEIPAELQGESGRRILLAPLFLLEEFAGAFIPGILFFSLLLEKNRAYISSAAYSFLGYRTKIALICLVAYLVGRVINDIVGSALIFLMQRKSEKLLCGNLNKFGVDIISKLDKSSRYMLFGFLAAPVMNGGGKEVDIYYAAKAGTSLELCSGVALLAGGLIPGGNLRAAELVMGLLLFIFGIRKRIEMRHILAMILGMTISRLLTERTLEENVGFINEAIKIPSILKSVFDVMTNTSSQPAPEISALKPTAQPAESTANSPHHAED